MVPSYSMRGVWLVAILISCLMYSPAVAQDVGPAARPAAQPVATGQQPPAQSAYRVAERSAPIQPAKSPDFGTAEPGEHPLMPALRWAYSGVDGIEKISDYSATLVKRERINGTLREHQYMFVKIRHDPFSVYMYFLGPPDLKGQEVAFIEGQNNGKMWAQGTGFQKTMFGTVALRPDGLVAMKGQRYPLTELGMLNMVRRLIEVAEHDVTKGECEVKFFKGAKVNDRSCTCIQVIHPVPRRDFLFHKARIFVDDELNMPVRYESYDWPKAPGEKPGLLEEYTYLNIKLNNKFTDDDFDKNNFK